MKIVHVSESFVGGIIDFVNHLTKSIDDHEHFIIYSLRFENFESFVNRFPKNVKFIEWKFATRDIKLYKDFKALIYLYKVLKTIDFEVLHLHSSKAGFLGRIVGILFRDKNIIYTPNGAPFERKDISSIQRRLFILLEKIASFFPGRIICSSLSEKNIYEKYGMRATYINNGIIINKKIAEINLPQTELLVVTVGRITAQKNPTLFNKIAKEFESNKRIRFVWIGDGEQRHLLSSRNIKITGWITREDVRANILLSHLYLSTALWEGLPFAVLEAMNLSKPLLLKNCVGNTDLVKDHYNGFIYENKEDAVNYINYLIDNPSLLKTFSYNSIELLRKEYNVHNMVESYEKEYTRY